MPTEKRGLAFRSLATLFATGTSTGLSDAQLLERFADRDELDAAAEAAFEALVLRHGPMVFDICRNVLGNHSHDTEDAFQATFLILATKAGSVRRKTSVASWLYGVALRTALRSKMDTARRRVKEHRAAESRGEEIEPAEAPRDFGILHEEVGRLPNKYRDPIILCYFEGMTHEMAAAQLRCPVATVGVRLMRAKARLKDRLGRRGESFAPAMVPLTSVSGSLVRSTVRSAIQFTEAGPVSLAVAQLTKEVSKAMFMIKLKAAAAVLLIGGTVASGAGYLTRFAAADDPPAKQAEGEPEAKSKPAKPKSDLEELQGTWLAQVKMDYVSNFKHVSNEIMKFKWIITGDTIRTFPQPTENQADFLREDTYLIKLNPRVSPKTIDLDMPALGTLSGIYEINGDSLKICWGFGKRPARFVHDPKNNSELVTLKRLRRTPEEIAPRFALDPGCYWVDYPSQPGGAHANRSFALMTEYESGVLRIHLARPATNLDEVPYRPVAFDADRKRYYPRPAGGAGTGGEAGKMIVALESYRLDKGALQGKTVKYVGVELVTPEALEREKANKSEKADKKPNAKP